MIDIHQKDGFISRVIYYKVPQQRIKLFIERRKFETFFFRNNYRYSHKSRLKRKHLCLKRKERTYRNLHKVF